MSLLIDTHAHIYLDVFDADRAAVMERTFSQVSLVLMPNIDLDSTQTLWHLADAYPEKCLPMMGLHPCSVKTDSYLSVLRQIEWLLPQRHYWAIGETGLDYYWDKSHIDAQKASLSQHIDWAKNLGKPLVLHCRDSFQDTIEMIEEAQDGRLTGVFHCFSGTIDEAKRVADVGFYMGLGGVITYKNNPFHSYLPQIPLERIVLETDCPYLPPVPHRGKRNEPAFIIHVAQKIAEALPISLDQVATITNANAIALFGLGQIEEKINTKTK